eukprot:Skav231498  [mRNA]  locus=scaffold3068:64937:65245:- [translate_table: standard]
MSALSASERLAVATEEAAKVRAWCDEQGVESSQDLAFLFLTYEEALQEAGRAVADAWQSVRQEVQPRLAVQVRQLAAETEPAAPTPVVVVPSTPPRVKAAPS